VLVKGEDEQKTGASQGMAGAPDKDLMELIRVMKGGLHRNIRKG
jgi:hypothetical protein